MARKPGIPSYRNRGGRAVVTLPDAAGNRILYTLGDYGSPESKAEYARLIAEWQVCRPKSLLRDLTVNELMVQFWEHAMEAAKLAGRAFAKRKESDPDLAASLKRSSDAILACLRSPEYRQLLKECEAEQAAEDSELAALGIMRLSVYSDEWEKRWADIARFMLKNPGDITGIQEIRELARDYHEREVHKAAIQDSARRAAKARAKTPRRNSKRIAAMVAFVLDRQSKGDTVDEAIKKLRLKAEWKDVEPGSIRTQFYRAK